MEHLRHFQLVEDPFRSDPLDKFDVRLPSQEDALARIDRAVRQGRGLVVLSGGVGSGKTRVVRRLYEELEEELFEAGMMVVLRRAVSADWLLVRMARQLGVEEPEADRDVLIGQIYERLAIIHEDGRRAVVIIDDAQGLADVETLSEVCSLVKLEYEERRLITVVLVGTEGLSETIASDPTLAHHVDVRVELRALPRAEAAGYLGSRVQVAGGNPEILLPGATAALHALADGAPGRMNILADNALFEAWVAQRDQVARNDVEKAYADLAWGPIEGAPEAAQEEAPVAPAPAPAAAAAAPASAEPEPLQALPPLETDEELDTIFASGEREMEPLPEAAPSTVVMDFDAPAADAEPVAETEIQLDEPLDAPPKEGDDVDDLFMELLDD
ncbi:MAG: AAA family ATPase [Myxococcota bacterium]